MKNRYTVLIGLCLMASAYIIAEECTQDYTRIIDVLKDFASAQEKPDTTMDYWITQMGFHIKPEEFAPFETMLRKSLRRPDPKRVQRIFLQHRHLFNIGLSDLHAIGIKKLQDAFKNRLEAPTMNKPLNSLPKDPLLDAVMKSLDRIEQREDSEHLKQMQQIWLAELLLMVQNSTIPTSS